MTAKIALLLFEFCHRTTGMNEVTAERQQRRREATDLTGRAKER